MGDPLAKLLAKIDEQVRPHRATFAASVLTQPLLGQDIDLSKLIQTALVQRLRGIRQLALTHLKPPDGAKWYARHNRLDHSIGVVQLVRLAVTSLLVNSGWFRFRYRDEDGVFLLLSALLHDLGHYPCAHYLEDTKVFPAHEQLTAALIDKDLKALWLDTDADAAVFGETVHGGHHERCETNHGKQASCYFRFCSAEDAREFHVALSAVLRNAKLDIEGFQNWHQALRSAVGPNEPPGRLVFRVLGGLVSGPIDADKLHYLVWDSLNCGLSLGAPLEGQDLVRLLLNLRVPIRQLEESRTQRFCLGLREDSVHLAQLVIFLRSAMFGEVYWSSNARSATSMLRFLLLESLFAITTFDSGDEAAKLVGEWVRADDDMARGIALSLAEKADAARKKGKGDDSQGFELKELWKDLFERGPEGTYRELCRIYPADRVAYRNIQQHVTDLGVRIGSRGVVGPTREIMTRIRDLVGEVLHLRPEDLKHGHVLVDVPAQKTSKRKEFTRLALVDNQGFGRPVGRVWDAIEDDFDDSIRMIRIFLRPDVVNFDREEMVAVRRAIITAFS